MPVPEGSVLIVVTATTVTVVSKTHRWGRGADARRAPTAPHRRSTEAALLVPSVPGRRLRLLVENPHRCPAVVDASDDAASPDFSNIEICWSACILRSCNDTTRDYRQSDNRCLHTASTVSMLPRGERKVSLLTRLFECRVNQSLRSFVKGFAIAQLMLAANQQQCRLIGQALLSFSQTGRVLVFSTHGCTIDLRQQRQHRVRDNLTTMLVGCCGAFINFRLC
jgi:hypothetical protein